MRRATLALTLALLAGIAGVLHVARQLDPLRVVERVVGAEVRTVDLAGSGDFVRRDPAAAPEPPPAAAGASDPSVGRAAGPEPAEPVAAPARRAGGTAPAAPPAPREAPPELAEEPLEVALAASRTAFDAGPEVPEEGALSEDSPDAVEEPPAPLDPDVSAELVRRMLALYERARERP